MTDGPSMDVEEDSNENLGTAHYGNFHNSSNSSSNGNLNDIPTTIFVDQQGEELINREITTNATSANAPRQVQQQQQQQQTNGSQDFSTAPDVPFQVHTNKKIKQKNKRPRELTLSQSSNEEMQKGNLSNNRFALLSDLSITTIPAIVQNNVSSQNNTTQNKDATSTKQTSEPTRTVSHRYLPPIILFNVDVRSLITQFKQKFPNIDIKIVNNSNKKSKLFIKNREAYADMMALLKERQISSHSFTPEHCKKVSLILRGIHYLTSPEEIKSELDILIPDTVDSVQVFLTPYMKKNEIQSNLFQITLLPGKEIKDILTIKYILYQKISWEKPKSSTKQLQCKRCQRWGHIAKNCNHPYQCVKCDKTHEAGQCLLGNSNETQPYCINCKKWGHPANFKGCEMYKSFEAQRNAKKQLPKLEAHAATSFISPNKSYASLFKKQTYPIGNNFKNSKLIQDFLTVAKQLFDTQPLSIEDQIENFMNNFKIMTAEDRKTECLNILKRLDGVSN